jgi:transposase
MNLLTNRKTVEEQGDGMNLTPDDIRELCLRYKHARDPREQIHIEAQLNAIRIKDVKDILKQNAEKYRLTIKSAPKKPEKDRITETDPEALARRNAWFLELYNQGLSDTEIAKKTGSRIAHVVHWRCRDSTTGRNSKLDGMRARRKHQLLEKVIEMYNQGCSYNRISHIFGITDRTVAIWIQEEKKKGEPKGAG